MCPTMTFKQRLIALICCCVLGYILEICGTLTLIGGPTARNIRKFSVLYVCGNLIAIMATAFWVGPKLMCKKMWNSTRRGATAMYLVSLVLVLVLALFARRGLRRAPHARRGALLRGLVLGVLRAEGAVVRRAVLRNTRRPCPRCWIQCRRACRRSDSGVNWFCGCARAASLWLPIVSAQAEGKATVLSQKSSHLSASAANKKIEYITAAESCKEQWLCSRSTAPVRVISPRHAT